MIKIAPSILSADFCNLTREIVDVEKAGADWIHLDVMDGQFVPNITMGPKMVKAVRRSTKLPLDVHLMIANPERWLSTFAEAGADMITVHAEACIHLDRTLGQIRELGKLAGVALNPSTSEQVLQYVLAKLDLILVMSVNPGFGGQHFIEEIVPKITKIRQMLDEAGNKQCLISVDGGINKDTAARCIQAGAQVLVAGNAIYESNDYGQAIKSLRGSN